MAWITPNIQKGVALAFIISWYLAQGRFSLAFQALAGKLVVSPNA